MIVGAQIAPSVVLPMEAGTWHVHTPRIVRPAHDSGLSRYSHGSPVAVGELPSIMLVGAMSCLCVAARRSVRGGLNGYVRNSCRRKASVADPTVAGIVVPARKLVAKGRVSAALPVPPHIVRPPYVAEPEAVRGWWNMRIQPKSAEDAVAMRAAGKLAHATLDLAGELIKPGVTSEELEAELHQFMCDGGAYPSDLLYKGFPKSVMISVNEVICHGIPDDRPMENGDLVNVDVTLYMNGFHADTARTWVCGETDDVGRRLISATKEALDAAVAACRPGAPMKVIGDAVSDIADREGFGVVKTLVGHGIGEFFHGVPQVFHTRTNDPRKMLEGTAFTIEPVLTEGSPDWITWDDGWTNATRDGGRAVQFEHTLMITADGCEVFT